MPQPPFAARTSNFLRDANAGLESPAPLAVDAELNALINVVNQLALRERQKTNADGTLRNVAAATAQSLAGTQTIVATASQTAFVTSIVWSAAFTTSNVFVFISGSKVDAVSVADNGGFLEVTLTAQPVSTSVTIAAFESGAGLLTRLQTPGSATEGAHLVALEDTGGYFAAVTVEGALQEEATAREALATAVGNTADLIRRTGTVDFTADQSMGGFNLKDLADGVDAQDAVTMNQFAAYTSVWNALEAYFLRLDGTATMAADLPMGGNKVTGMADGVAGTDAASVTQLGLKVDKAGDTMTGTLVMSDNFIQGVKDAVLDTDAVNKRTALSLVASFSTRSQYTSAQTATPFIIPAGINKIRARVWGGGAGGGAATAAPRYGGGAGAYTEAVLTVTPGETLNITVGAGGAAENDGGNSFIQRGATVLMQSNGGIKGTTTGLGGAYSFDGSVTGLGINGGSGHGYRMNVGAGEPTGQSGGHGGSAPMGGAGGQASSVTAGGSYGNTTAGDAPGGGGGGYGYAAAAGAAGRVEIEY